MEKQLKESLKHCKNKDEAANIYISTTLTAAKICGIKGNSGVHPNKAKYKRLMKRLQRVWKEYQEGKLNKTEGKEKVKTDSEYGDSVKRKRVIDIQINALTKIQNQGTSYKGYDQEA